MDEFRELLICLLSGARAIPDGCPCRHYLHGLPGTTNPLRCSAFVALLQPKIPAVVLILLLNRVSPSRRSSAGKV